MADAPNATPVPAPPPGSKLTLVMAGLLVLNLGATGFLAVRSLKQQAHAEKAEHEKEGGETVAGPTVAIDSFVVNLKEPGSDRYLKVALEAEMADAAAATKLTASKSATRDELIRYLSSLSVADTVGGEAKEKILAGVKERIEKLVGAGKLRKIFITEFVVQ